MDPFTIAATCATVVSKTGSLAISITHFLADIRDTKDDVDLVLRELASVQLCLASLANRGQHQGLDLPETMRQQIGQILINIDFIVTKMEEQIRKLGSYSLKRKMQWAFSKKEDINKFRTSLESYKTALEVALTTHTIAMLAQLNTDNATEKDSLDQIAEQIGTVSLTTRDIDQKLDTVISLQKNDTKTTLIVSEIARLRQGLTLLSQNSTMQRATQAIAEQSWIYTKDVTQALQDKVVIEASFQPTKIDTAETQHTAGRRQILSGPYPGFPDDRVVALTKERDALLERCNSAESSFEQAIKDHNNAYDKIKLAYHFVQSEHQCALSELQKTKSSLNEMTNYADRLKAYYEQRIMAEDHRYNALNKIHMELEVAAADAEKRADELRSEYNKLLCASQRSIPPSLGVSSPLTRPRSTPITPIVEVSIGVMYTDVSLDIIRFFIGNFPVRTMIPNAAERVVAEHKRNCEVGGGSSYVQLWDGCGTDLKMAHVKDYLMSVLSPLLSLCRYNEPSVLLARGSTVRRSMTSLILSDFTPLDSKTFYIALVQWPDLLDGDYVVPDFSQTSEALSPEEVMKMQRA